jgi:hypothetical protein
MPGLTFGIKVATKQATSAARMSRGAALTEENVQFPQHVRALLRFVEERRAGLARLQAILDDRARNGTAADLVMAILEGVSQNEGRSPVDRRGRRQPNPKRVPELVPEEVARASHYGSTSPRPSQRQMNSSITMPLSLASVPATAAWRRRWRTSGI